MDPSNTAFSRSNEGELIPFQFSESKGSGLRTTPFTSNSCAPRSFVRIPKLGLIPGDCGLPPGMIPLLAKGLTGCSESDFSVTIDGDQAALTPLELVDDLPGIMPLAAKGFTTCFAPFVLSLAFWGPMDSVFGVVSNGKSVGDAGSKASLGIAGSEAPFLTRGTEDCPLGSGLVDATCVTDVAGGGEAAIFVGLGGDHEADLFLLAPSEPGAPENS